MKPWPSAAIGWVLGLPACRSSVLGLATLFAGCSFTTVRPDACTSNQECRDAFGLGSVCGEGGLCAVAEVPDRCATLYPSDLVLPVDPATTLVMGTVFDHTLDTHVGRYRSAELAATQANANDGLDGRQFAFFHCTNQEGGFDLLDKVEASVSVSTWLADQVGVPAIVGPAASTDVEAVYNAVSPTFGTLVISPSATSPSLTALDGLESTDQEPGLLWRTAPPDSLQGYAIAQDMLHRTDVPTSTNVAVIFQIGAYGYGLEETFTAAMTAGGGQTTSLPFDSAQGPGDAIADAANGGFDEVLFISSDVDDVVAFLLGAKDIAGFAQMPIFLTDAARNTDVLNDAAAASALFDQIRGTAPANPSGPVFDSFAASYSAANAGEDVTLLSYTAQSFDAAWLVMYGHAWSDAQEDGIGGLGLARGLRHVSDGAAVDIRPTNWNEIKSHFRNGEGVDVTGASGALDYDEQTAETTAPIAVWVILPDHSGFEEKVVYTL